MPENLKTVKSLAPLQNVSLFFELLDRLVDTPPHLTPLGVFFGFSGYGKTCSACYGANKHRSLYIEVGASWTLKKFCQNLLKELGIPASKTVADMVEQLIEALSLRGSPLIIDEFDHVANFGEKSVNIVREILDKARTPIVLIGEEMLPARLKRWERFDNRVRSWVAAQPVNFADAKHLLGLYAPNVQATDGIIKDMLEQSKGVTRRICVGIEALKEFSETRDIQTISQSNWGNLPFFEARPLARKAS